MTVRVVTVGDDFLLPAALQSTLAAAIAVSTPVTTAISTGIATAVLPVGRILTAASTITSTDRVVLFNSASAISQALPAVGTIAAYTILTFTNKGAGVVTLTTSIGGTLNRTLAQWATLRIYTDGTLWLLG